MGESATYPIGQQNFSVLRKDGATYVDKTAFIEKIAKSHTKYYFLARPRRFGKSLFLSTLRYFFEGRRDLFSGLSVDSMDWDWEPYPVLYLDFNTGDFNQPNGMEGLLEEIFSTWENRYEVVDAGLPFPQRFKRIIEAAHKKTDKQVVILVDEYDKALVRNLRKKDNLEHYRSWLASIYANFKSSAEHIRLVFLTGVSRFSKLSVFSDLNNLNDISFDNDFADICGITEQELLDNFRDGISRLAKEYGIGYEEAVLLLKENYDGYRFAKNGSDIYNPWSVLNALSKREIIGYWNETGKPTIVAEALKGINADLEKYLNQRCTLRELRGMDLTDVPPTALLYQTGYLTIKDYNRKIDEFRLGLPNKEVTEGFLHDLLPYYLKLLSSTPDEVIRNIVRSFILGEPQNAMTALQTYFAGVDYALKIENENNFHNAFFLLTNLIGLYTKAESHTSDGRIDIEILTDDYIYIIELKYDHPAHEALRQIEENRYARKYRMDARKIFLIGVEFSSRARCIEGWEIREV